MATIVAVVVAVALSGWYPVGIGDQLELDPGLDLNVTVVLVGALVVLGLVLGLSFLLGWPRTRRSAGAAPRRSIATGLVPGGCAPADVYVGAHFAFDRGRGMRSISPRLSILAGALALGVVVALAMLVSGIDRLYRVPAEHGWPWDTAIGNVNFPLSAETRQQLADDPRLEGRPPRTRYGQAVVGGMPVEILAVEQAGTAPPQLVSGSSPAHPMRSPSPAGSCGISGSAWATPYGSRWPTARSTSVSGRPTSISGSSV